MDHGSRGSWPKGTKRALVCAVGIVLLVALVGGVVGSTRGSVFPPQDEEQAWDGSDAGDAPDQGDAGPSADAGDASDASGADASPDGSADTGDASDANDVSSQGDLEDVDPSATPSDDTLEARLNAYLDASLPQTRMPGVAVAVVDAYGTVYERTLGDITSTNAPLLIGSLSKSFTAVCVMQLVEAGEVSLDAPANLYLAHTGSLPDAITVRDLLNQTSGLGYYDSLAQALARTEPGDTAGSFSYANANYDLLGRIVEDVSGESYASYLQKHVLEPLGMGRTSGDMRGTFADGTSVASALVPGHRNWFGAYVADGFVHAAGDDAWGSGSSGYVASSLDDMERYLEMYLTKGAVPGSAGAQRVLSPLSVDQMFLSRVPDPGGDTYYGMGWTSFSWDNDELVLSHDGSVEGYCARMVLLPDRGVGIVMLADGSDEVAGSNLFFEMADGVVATVAGDAPDPVDGSWYADEHVKDDVLYALALVACAVPLLWVTHWRRFLAREGRTRLATVLRLLPYVVLPVLVLARPLSWDVPWRDLLTFVPDVSAVLIACAALLLVAGLRRLLLIPLGTGSNGTK